VFRKISSVLYEISIATFIISLIAYLLSLTNIEPFLIVVLPIYLIGLQFDLLADLLKIRKPFTCRIGKTLLALDLLTTALFLFGGLFYLFFGDITFGIPLTAGGIIAIILSAKIFRLNKLLKQKSQSQT